MFISCANPDCVGMVEVPTIEFNSDNVSEYYCESCFIVGAKKC